MPSKPHFYLFPRCGIEANFSSFGIVPLVHVTMFFFLILKNIPLYFINLSTSISNTSPKVLSHHCANISMPERINLIAIAL